MKSNKLAILYGVLVWLVPFITGFLAYSIRTSNRVLFESAMPVVVAFSVVLFSTLYLKNVGGNFLKEGILLGILWFVISIAIDLVMFMPESPMKMSFAEYIMDIGLTYLIIPVTCIGSGYLLQIKIRGDEKV
ncbi:MAG: hypothetical protein HZB67_00100 [Candidatus Aenigmarchaeota archaeon]|nr:hypothetical protein [Candidatus Aenigmarchaeota archaeon]